MGQSDVESLWRKKGQSINMDKVNLVIKIYPEIQNRMTVSYHLNTAV